MAAINDAISLEYLQSIEGAANGLATLDSTGKIPESQLPADSTVFVGDYADLATLTTDHPTGTSGQYAIVAGTQYYWNAAMSPAAWTSVNITATAYLALTDAQKAGQPFWRIIP